ncbi:MAG: hypothetical protein LBJ73_03645 [Rickettsiales bacterium]|jgi:hypothetical protein|nr:hypothetical protein [Rickettsiales bacterium]
MTQKFKNTIRWITLPLAALTTVFGTYVLLHNILYRPVVHLCNWYDVCGHASFAIGLALFYIIVTIAGTCGFFVSGWWALSKKKAARIWFVVLFLVLLFFIYALGYFPGIYTPIIRF